MTMITPSYLGETIEYSSLHACRSTLEDPTAVFVRGLEASLLTRQALLAERYHPKHRQAPWPPAYR